MTLEKELLGNRELLEEAVDAMLSIDFVDIGSVKDKKATA